MVNITDALRLGVVIFPGFTALDVFGPLQPLNLLSSQREPWTLSLIADTMDPVSIDRNIVDNIPGDVVPGQSAISPFFTQYILPTHTFATAPPELDIILVPGGNGTRNFTNTQPAVDWLTTRFDDPGLQYMMTVCTGASVLARTGKMAGRNATTNKAAFKWVTGVPGAEEVSWVEKARWVVDGGLWTSSGVSAGTDMMLGWLGEYYGEKTKEMLRIGMEWNGMGREDDPFARP